MREATIGPDDAIPGVGRADVRVRLDLAYDGTGFSGWARQPGRRTVQGVLEDALATVLRLGAPPPVTVAGRTDAGVHARGQVAHVDLPAEVFRRAEASLARRLLGLLPPDVRVHAVTRAPDGFDARFSALHRRYAYRVCDDPLAFDPLRRHDVLVHPRPLDLAAMNAASAPLLGEHDFAAFCRRREGATTVRRLLALETARDAAGHAVTTVVADAFCHSMVRALIGALLPVGEGRKPPEWPARVLAGHRRDPGVTVAAALGLTLEAVAYPGDAELAARVAETRRVRPAPGPAGL